MSRAVIAYARTQIGKPHVYGGTGPDGFDCSGFAMMAYRGARITIPACPTPTTGSASTSPAGTEQHGDLVFFDSKPGRTGP